MINSLSITADQLVRFYELARAANAIGVPGDTFVRLDSPLACAARSIPVPLDPNEACGDGWHTEALMGCIAGTLSMLTYGSTLFREDLGYRFIGMCSAEGDTGEAYEAYAAFFADGPFGGQSVTAEGFSFEPYFYVYEVEPGHWLVLCDLFAEGYNCQFSFELKIIANNFEHSTNTVA